MNKICRLCFMQSSEIINIFDDKNELIEFNIPEIITKHFWFKVNEDDSFPNVICNSCWKYTEDFHKFYTYIEFTQNDCNFMKDYIKNDQWNNTNNNKPNKTLTTEESSAAVFKTSTLPSSHVEIPSDGLDSVFLNDSLNAENCVAFIKVEENLTNFDGMIDVGMVNQQSNNHNDNIGVMITENMIKCDVSTGETDQLNIKDYTQHGGSADDQADDSSDNRPIFELRNRKRVKIKSNVIVEQRKQAKKRNTKSIKSTMRKKELKLEKDVEAISEIRLQREREDIQICQYFKMECDLCKYKCITFLEIKKHYREVHNLKGFLQCCERKFYHRGTILEHIQCHLNPNVYKCDNCNKMYTTKRSLMNHIDEHHVPSDKKPFKCTVCSKSFSKECQLKYHIKYRHYVEEDKKFRCNECSKCFMTKFFLDQHMRCLHESSNIHICDICAKVFKSKYSLELHYKSHFPDCIEPKLQCNICGSWLKNKHGLQKHMRLHSDTVQTCPECGCETPNRNALRNHMNYVHSERSHACPLCDKAFKKPIGLREHMASHTGEALYTCPHCPQTFNSGANMYSHRKKVHPVEWRENRIKRGIMS